MTRLDRYLLDPTILRSLITEHSLLRIRAALPELEQIGLQELARMWHEYSTDAYAASWLVVEPWSILGFASWLREEEDADG